MPSKRPALLAAALLAAVAAAGCGQAGQDTSSDFKGQSRQVAQAVEDLQSAARSGDQEKICNELLTSSLADRIAAAGRRAHRGTCPEQLKHSLRDVDGFELKVQKVTVSGTTASARVKNTGSGNRDELTTLTLVRQGTPPRWRIGTLGG